MIMCTVYEGDDKNKEVVQIDMFVEIAETQEEVTRIESMWLTYYPEGVKG